MMPTVALAVPLPPLPVQVRVKVAALVSAPVDSLPAVARVPLQAPLAVQEVAWVEDQVSVVAAPLVTLPTAAVRVTLGGGAGVPPLPPPPQPARISAQAASTPSAAFHGVAFRLMSGRLYPIATRVSRVVVTRHSSSEQPCRP